MFRYIKKSLGNALDVLFPRFCVSCQETLMRGERSLCISCSMQMVYLHHEDFVDGELVRLFMGRVELQRAASYVKYDKEGVSHQLLWAIKYGRRPDVARDMARALASELKLSGFFDGIDCLVPVPLHWKRWWQRGYNQSMQLALGVADVTGIAVEGATVRRVRNNPSQTHLSDEERKDNVKDLFRIVHPERLRGKHILIIDDVVTTGSTIASLAVAIQNAVPDAQISVLTLARA